METAVFDGMYTGCDYDAETGLTYHWNRWRSEDGSSFISEDPARDGANWYGYAGQNTVVYVDRIGFFYYTAEGQQSSTSNTPKTNTNRKSGSYSREAAVTYSQVLHAGGISIRSDWFNNSGEFNFLGRRTDKNYSTNWTTAKGLSNWLRKQEDIYNGESLLRNGKNFKSDLTKALELTKIGDVIGWSKR